MLEDPVGAFYAHGRATLQTRHDGALGGVDIRWMMSRR